jgi:hypothetical protein
MLDDVELAIADRVLCGQADDAEDAAAAAAGEDDSDDEEGAGDTPFRRLAAALERENLEAEMEERRAELEQDDLLDAPPAPVLLPFADSMFLCHLFAYPAPGSTGTSMRAFAASWKVGQDGLRREALYHEAIAREAVTQVTV